MPFSEFVNDFHVEYIVLLNLVSCYQIAAPSQRLDACYNHFCDITTFVMRSQFL